VSGYRDIWATLGIARSADIAAIRAAYARTLKSFDVDAEPQRFMALRAARDNALRLARQQAEATPDLADEASDEDPPKGADDTMLSLVAPALPDAARITGLVAQAIPASGTVSTAIPTAPDGDYRDDGAPVVAPDSGDGVPLPDLAARATLVPPVIDATRRGGVIGLALSDTAHEALIDQHYDAVRRLLAPRRGAAQESYLDTTEELALAGHVDALLADPRLDQIAFREQAEAWFADMAANAVPRSDSIVERLVAAFGWAADRGRIDQPYNVARVLSRRDSLVFFRLVQEKKHPLNAAWRELVKPATADSRRGFWVNRGEVQRLLKVVRENFPDLESCFDWYRVSLWETPGRVGRGGAWRPAYFALIVLLGVLRVAFSGGDDHRPIAMPTPMSSAAMMAAATTALASVEADRQRIKANDRVSDIAMALRDATGGMLTNDDVKASNPKLGADLMTAWQTAHGRGDSRSDFVDRTRRELIRRANVALRHASYGLAAESRQLELDQFQATRLQSPAMCGALMDGGPMPPIIRTRFADRENALIRHALLESDGRGAMPTRGKFSVPAAVMKDAAARAALSHEDLVAALNHHGSSSRTCDARIALLQTVLALAPKDGLALLREM
jgi:hypothetical protein